MAQQDSSDFSAKFSTLNVNAMEFVPSFAYSGAGATSPATTTNTTSSSSSHPSSVTTNNDVSQDGEITAATVAAAAAAGGGAPTTTASVTPLSSAPSSQQTTPTSAAAPAVPPPPAVADPPVPTAATAPPVTVPPVSMSPPEDRSPQNNDNEPIDSWDVDDDPISTPEDEEAGDLEDGENEEEIIQKISKKKATKIDENHSKKEHVNVVFIGHVDAGKSTIGGQIMALTGMVDKRTLEKNQREAREKSRESWYLSWALDTNSEEREKGKTVEVGRAFFETERKHFTILDAPGHKSFVPNMIGGAAQADLAVLVISARKGEFETGFDRGGQTREHAMLAKTAGVKHLVVLVNKMDDPTVNWDEERYNECRDKILPYLKKLGFSPNKDLTFMPCSGLTGLGLKDSIDEMICPWYQGSTFITFIDQLPSLNRKLDGPFIMPIVDKYKDMGTVVMGKVESGCAKKAQNLLVMPNRTQVSVDQLFSDDYEVTSIAPGENVKIKLKGIEEEDVSPGFVLCDASNPIKIGKIFDAQVVILEHKSIICAGYSAVMHIHCAAEEITVKALICLVDKKTGEKSKTRPRFVKQDQVAIMRIECSGLICLEPFKLFPQMGRFTLRDENDPADSWDAEKEPDDEEAELEEGDNEEVIVKASKKKRPEVEDEDTVKKEHVNVVFIGHVDAGKSTIGGQIMTLTGMIDKRTFEKIQREAREKSRENWAFSWALDTNAEEREEGKTVEIGRAFFETERKHFTILDAPGHKSFVPNMIGGAAQADLAVLVISARKGEFETGFERGGQTREHAMLAKTAGVKHLVVLVNKMDDPTVNWDEGRYNECRDKIMPYLKKLGFSLNKDLTFMPCSGLAGLGLREPIDESICPWYRGSAFIPFIDNLPTLNRRADGPFVMPIADKYKDMGVVVMGKVESGCVKKGQNLMIMPNKIQVAVDQLLSDDCEVTTITPGENVKIKLKGVDEEEISTGFVLCDISNPIKVGKIFDAQVVILEHKSIICAGYSAVMHIHCAAEEITVKALLCLVEKKTGEKSKTRPRFVKQDQVAIMRIECSGSICLETFKEFPQMGRFTLRDENKTIAMGKVLKVIE